VAKEAAQDRPDTQTPSDDALRCAAQPATSQPAAARHLRERTSDAPNTASDITVWYGLSSATAPSWTSCAPRTRPGAGAFAGVIR
jgi:hypothetical protein